jgi:hypothetical protein
MDGDARARTLGELLNDAARRLSARHTPAYAWAGGLARVLDRTARLSAPHEQRFERLETHAEGPAARLPLIGAPSAHRDLGARAGWPRPPRAGVAPADHLVAQSEAVPADDHSGRRDAGRQLPSDVRSRLRALAGPAADAVRVHDDSPADALARAHQADAVTVGRDVHFRACRYAERQERSFGLLAHEAVHVMALLKPPPGWRRGTLRGIAEEEGAALAAERAARAAAVPRRPTALAPSSGFPDPAPPAAPRAAPVTAEPASPTAAAVPMRAPADRDSAAPAPAPDLEHLRRSLVEDLMRRLRAEFERGA